MTVTHSDRYGHPNSTHLTSWGPPAALASAIAAGCAMWFYVARNHTAEMLLPAIATMFFALAALLAAIAWNRATSQSALNYRDVTGLLVMLGICAAAAIEPDQMVQLLQGKR